MLDVKGVEDTDLDEVLAVDGEWRELKATGDELRHERNETRKVIASDQWNS